ncbi:MAG: SDR family NAD(P)-dependent oxidoreductase, partial [Acidimicrobiales bacterium]|nr:SDR family NAD(P)-dependent oxidoreductase [Acidimicrobiales bacterium]
MTSYEGKVALITGGSKGIGGAVAKKLTTLGAKVALVDIEQDQGKALAEELGGIYINCDVRDFGEMERAFNQTIDAYGQIDIAHLNAGVATGFSLGEEFDTEHFKRVMEINFDGVVYGMHLALRAMKAKQGGDIIATASMAGIVPVPMDPIYSANKHAVVGLVRSVGNLFGPSDNIRVNALCPSFADTDIIKDVKSFLQEAHFPILSVDEVVETFMQILYSNESGKCWFVVPGRESQP